MASSTPEPQGNSWWVVRWFDWQPCVNCCAVCGRAFFCGAYAICGSGRTQRVLEPALFLCLQVSVVDRESGNLGDSANASRAEVIDSIMGELETFVAEGAAGIEEGRR